MKNKFELIPSRSNKLVDENGKVYESLRELEREIGVQHSVIGVKLKKDGYFKFNGVTYYAVNTRPVVAENKKEEEPVISNEEFLMKKRQISRSSRK